MLKFSESAKYCALMVVGLAHTLHSCDTLVASVDYVQFGVGIEILGGLTVHSLTPGCSAEKSGNVELGDEICAVDGTENLTVPQAKQMMLGR
jgi:C-terminal processing protease CtpA/Prc